MKNTIFTLCLLSLFAFSCEDDDPATTTVIDPPEVIEEDGPFATGYFVTNEGPFSNGFGSVSHINSELAAVENDIYQSVNGDNLGNIVQSMTMSDTLAYVVTNISTRITVLKKDTFEERTRITSGIDNPRHMTISGNKGFVTNWGDPNVSTDDFIAVIDLIDNEVISTIPVAEGPEKIITSGDVLYVAHQGGFGVNNIVSVISISEENVITTVQVGDVPNSLQIDNTGRLVVLSGGAPEFTGMETGGRFSIIDTASNQLVQSFIFPDQAHPNYLNIVESDAYYYLNGAVYKTTIDGFTNATQPILIDVSFYNMVILENRVLAGCNAADFASNGTIEFYDLSTNMLINTVDVGVVPGNIYSIN